MSGAADGSVASRDAPRKSRYERLKPGPGKSASAVAEHQCARLRAAMLALVADRGYRAVTVRELAQTAGVSSRAFYEHYSSKEECFLAVHESIARRIDRAIAAAREGEDDWKACLQLTVAAYLRELQSDLPAARLLLVDSYAAGEPALGHVRRAERTLELRLGECFKLAGASVALPSVVTRGMSGGMTCVVRSRLIGEGVCDLADLSKGLTAWAGSVLDATSNFSLPNHIRADSDPNYRSTRLDRRSSWPVTDERGLIVAALAKLAVVEKYHEMTTRKVRISAGASSRKFTSYFKGVDDCFKEAAELYIGTVAAELASHGETADNKARDNDPVDSVGSLCRRATCDPAFATLCFADVFGPGLSGAQSLDRVIEELGVVLLGGPTDANINPLALEASTAAIWAALREEILCGRSARSARTVADLQIFVLSWIKGPKDRKRFAQQFDQRSPRRDARKMCESPGSEMAATTN